MIECRHLTKRYGRRTAVDDLSFTVRPGAVTGFLGPNGAGKSTTLRLILDLDRGGGSATVGGRRVRDLPDPARVVGAVLEGRAFHPARTARAHLRMLAAGIGVPDPRADEVLELVGLADDADRRAGGFSLGMGQRLGLAAALLGDPEVIVLDEPGNGLDPQGLHWLRNLLRGYAAEGRTVLVSSHQLAEVESLVDDVLVVARGRLVAAGSKAAVVGEHSDLEDAFLAAVAR